MENVNNKDKKNSCKCKNCINCKHDTKDICNKTQICSKGCCACCTK